MTTCLDEGIAAIRRLPAERQDVAGRMLLTLAGQSGTAPRLTGEQLAEVELALCEADAGDFATDEQMRRVWQPGP